MEATPKTDTRTAGSLFWKIWERVWWIVALLVIGGGAWAGTAYGWLKLARCFLLLLGILGGAVLMYGLRSRRRALESKWWPCAEARIIRSEVVRELTSRSDDPVPIYAWYPEIEYEYSAVGRRYVSSRVLLVRVNFPADQAQALVERYRPGSVARAYYDPARPGFAVLEPGLAGHEGRYAIPLIVGACFMVAGFAGALLLWRR
jgi:hypothetical protein